MLDLQEEEPDDGESATYSTVRFDPPACRDMQYSAYIPKDG